MSYSLQESNQMSFLKCQTISSLLFAEEMNLPVQSLITYRMSQTAFYWCNLLNAAVLSSLVHVSLSFILNNVQVCFVVFHLPNTVLSRYLSVLIIEARLKSQQQRDSFGRVIHFIAHNYIYTRCTPQLHSVPRLFTGRSFTVSTAAVAAAAAPLFLSPPFTPALCPLRGWSHNTSSCSQGYQWHPEGSLQTSDLSVSKQVQ